MTDAVDLETTSPGSPRALIEQRVAERASRLTAEQVEEACSFARAERILGREYHGRFLIELLQNAADAWRATRAGTGTERTDVRIVLSSGHRRSGTAGLRAAGAAPEEEQEPAGRGVLARDDIPGGRPHSR